MISPLLHELAAALALDQQSGHPGRRSALIDPPLLQELHEAQPASEGSLSLPRSRRLYQICGRLIGMPADNTPLIEWGMPVSAIAAELGYRNSSAFITMFRRAMGETPQRFLRRRTAS